MTVPSSASRTIFSLMFWFQPTRSTPPPTMKPKSLTPHSNVARVFVHLMPTIVALVLLNAAHAQTTVTDNFNTSQNYLSSGVAGTIWDGVYFGTNEFPRE